mgnify:CR=1 FL=1
MSKGRTSPRPIRRVNYHHAVHRYDKTRFANPSRRKFKPRRTGCVAYSASAPNISLFTLDSSGEPTALPPLVEWVANIKTDRAWHRATDDIRLAYINMTGTGNTEGLIINPLNTDGELPSHYRKATRMMERPKTSTDVTEATGEVAAAYAISQKPEFGGFKLKWGLGQHAGAGIDQIWRCEDRTSITYLIVEAKGPGQTLRRDRFAPSGVSQQMSKGWIVDRLARMLHGKGATLAQEIFDNIGAEATVPRQYTQQVLGGGTSYYAAASRTGGSATTKHVVLRSLVATARWTRGPRLGASLTDRKSYTDLF